MKKVWTRSIEVKVTVNGEKLVLYLLIFIAAILNL
jgi:hypothetical protein